MTIATLSKPGFTSSRCPVTNEVSPNVAASFAGFHISHCTRSSDYGCETTAIVLQNRVFFILNGDHGAELNAQAHENGIDGCIRYFAQHIGQANGHSEHLMAVGLATDHFELRGTTQKCIGSDAIELVAKAATALAAASQ